MAYEPDSTGNTEIVVTEAMIEAGIGALLSFYSDCEDRDQIVTEVFREMTKAQKRL